MSRLLKGFDTSQAFHMALVIFAAASLAAGWIEQAALDVEPDGPAGQPSPVSKVANDKAIMDHDCDNTTFNVYF